MRDVVIELRGGVLVEVYTADLDIRITVIDWDRTNEGDGSSAGFEWHPSGLAQMPADTSLEYLSVQGDIRPDKPILASAFTS